MKSNFDNAVESALTNEFSWLDDLKNPYSNYVFSSGFEKNMEKIIPKAEYRYVNIGNRRVRKLLVVALVAILAMAITGCAFAIHYAIEWNETQNDAQDTLDINFNSNEISHDYDSYAVIPDIPKGYSITEESGDDYTWFINYSNPDGTEIYFTRCNDLENISISIDNQDVDLKEISINGYKGYTYIKDNVNIIYWTDSNCFYVLQGTCDMNILIKMAKGVSSN